MTRLDKITTGKENFALVLEKAAAPKVVSMDQCITVLEAPVRSRLAAT